MERDISFLDSYKQNFNSYTHIFGVQLFNGIVDDGIGNHVIQEINLAAAITGSNTVSAHRTARKTRKTRAQQ